MKKLIDISETYEDNAQILAKAVKEELERNGQEIPIHYSCFTCCYSFGDRAGDYNRTYLSNITRQPIVKSEEVISENMYFKITKKVVYETRLTSRAERLIGKIEESYGEDYE